MQDWVIWWCNLIGVTDAVSIEIATGIIAASIVPTAAYICLYLVIFLGSLMVTWIVTVGN